MRFDLIDGLMESDDFGMWVRHEDYAALEATLKEKMSALEYYASKANKLATALEEIAEYDEDCNCKGCCSCIAREALKI